MLTTKNPILDITRASTFMIPQSIFITRLPKTPCIHYVALEMPVIETLFQLPYGRPTGHSDCLYLTTCPRFILLPVQAFPIAK